jgi:hypothetical protein
VVVDLGAERKNAVDDQDCIAGSRRDHGGVIDLGERVDAAQHAVPRAGRAGRLEQ